jgi:hypothetical protein
MHKSARFRACGGGCQGQGRRRGPFAAACKQSRHSHHVNPVDGLRVRSLTLAIPRR